MGIVSFVKMEVAMNILIGLSWLKKNGGKFIKLQALRIVVGCVEAWNMIVRSTKKKLNGLLGNQWSSLNEQKLNLCINCIGSVLYVRLYVAYKQKGDFLGK